MASLDYAAVADNATRELGVLITESPELAKIIKDVRGAADCLTEVAEDAKDIVDEFVELEALTRAMTMNGKRSVERSKEMMASRNKLDLISNNSQLASKLILTRFNLIQAMSKI